MSITKQQTIQAMLDSLESVEATRAYTAELLKTPKIRVYYIVKALKMADMELFMKWVKQGEELANQACKIILDDIYNWDDNFGEDYQLAFEGKLGLIEEYITAYKEVLGHE